MLESCLNIVNPIDARVLSLEQAESTVVAGVAALTNDIANVQTAVNNNSTAITNVQNSMDENKSAIETLQSTVEVLNSDIAKETSVSELSTMITELETKVDTVIENSGSSTSKYDSAHLVVGEIIALKHSTFGDILFEVVGKDIDGQGSVTLLSRDIISTLQWHTSNTGNYSSSTIRTWLNGEFYNGFDPSIKPLIRQVSKSQNLDASNNMETTQEYCWLLSKNEFINNIYNINNKIKHGQSETSVIWALRSPGDEYTSVVYYVSTDKNTAVANKTNDYGIAVAIVL